MQQALGNTGLLVLAPPLAGRKWFSTSLSSECASDGSWRTLTWFALWPWSPRLWDPFQVLTRRSSLISDVLGSPLPSCCLLHVLTGWWRLRGSCVAGQGPCPPRGQRHRSSEGPGCRKWGSGPKTQAWGQAWLTLRVCGVCLTIQDHKGGEVREVGSSGVLGLLRDRIHVA